MLPYVIDAKQRGLMPRADDVGPSFVKKTESDMNEPGQGFVFHYSGVLGQLVRR